MKDTMKIYTQPAFLICAATLAIAVGTILLAIEGFSGFFKKTPLPLRKPLSLLDERQLTPYRVVVKSKIENKEIIKELGTADYIQWVVEDSTISADSAVHRCLLFITYYELPDRVPHVPEECYTGGGYQRLATDSVTFEINKKGIAKEIQGKYLVFGSTNSGHWHRSMKFPVLYLFRVNGDYAGSRDEARIALNKNLFGEYSYFCKIELVYNQGRVWPSREEAVAACEKLLAVILPILESEHWPEWPVVNGK